MERIKDSDMTLNAREISEARERRLEAQNLQEIESNPLSADDIAMFEMFEREGWAHEKRRAYIMSQTLADLENSTLAAE